jgi:hypothetical protein
MNKEGTTMAESDKHQVALRALHDLANEIRAEIERRTGELTKELSRVEKAIAELSGEPVSGTSPAAQAMPSVAFSGLGPQGAVEQFLRDHPGQAFRPKEIATAIRSGGFVFSNPTLANQQVLIALIRAAKKGIADEVTVDGRRAFAAKGISIVHDTRSDTEALE